jgi:ABC-2 type transport system ATP-binding protein
MTQARPTLPAGVSVQGLSVTYGHLEALCDVTFQVPAGELFAILGPNGAGKSTLLQVLSTSLAPREGSVTVAGHDCQGDPEGVRRRIGIVFQDSTLDRQLTVRENLEFYGALYGLSGEPLRAAVEAALDAADLAQRTGSVVDTLSGGLARRLEVARAFMHRPDVLILDEPTRGLDPEARTRLRDQVQRLQRETGATVVLATHYMEEAAWADRVAILDAGRLVACASPADLMAGLGQAGLFVETGDDAAAASALELAGFPVARSPDGIRVSSSRPDHDAGRVAQAIQVPIKRLSLHSPTMEDVFRHYTGRAMPADGGAEPSRQGRR